MEFRVVAEVVTMFTQYDDQLDFFDGFNALIGWVGEDTFHGWIGREGRSIFRDEYFRDWYCDDNGAPCIPPSTLALASLLQMHGNCSDAEAVNRSKYDERWKCALDIRGRRRPFAESTLQHFRAKLHADEEKLELFLKLSLDAARKWDVLNDSPLTCALDTTPIIGRGAVKDTYNLIGEGIKKLCRVISQVSGKKLESLTHHLGLTSYFEASSLKGEAKIDWSNKEERQVFLNKLVADARRILLESAKLKISASENQVEILEKAEELLKNLITQDTEPDDPNDPNGKVSISEGVTRGRSPSASDPDQKHVRKSASKRYNGHKLGVSVDPMSGLALSLEVFAGNLPDSTGALELVNQAEANTGSEVEKSVGDCAYGGGATRKEFEDEGRSLVTKVPSPPRDQPYHKHFFEIDLVSGKVTCPEDRSTTNYTYVKKGGQAVRRYQFDPETCQNCPAKAKCIRSKKTDVGRTVTLHPQEDLLQKARVYQASEEFREDNKLRQSVEHYLARYVQFGGRQARYLGLSKTKLQAVLTATMINLLLVFSRTRSLPELPTPICEGAPSSHEASRYSQDEPLPTGMTNEKITTAHRRPDTSQVDRVRGGPESVYSSHSPCRGDPHSEEHPHAA